jgi:hypothetical protein
MMGQVQLVITTAAAVEVTVKASRVVVDIEGRDHPCQVNISLPNEAGSY